MILEQRLAELRAKSAAEFPAETKKQFRQSIDELRSSGIMERALNVGAVMPSFSLPNTTGETINSADLLKRGNLVVTFYRGVW